MPLGESKRRVSQQKPIKLFDKFALYHEAVQSADVDVVLYQEIYQELTGRNPKILREDFCGTFALSCEWVRLNPKYRAYGVDLDPEPLEYGRRNYLSKLKPHQQKRLEIVEKDVLKSGLPAADLVVAMNFSYFVFRKRQMMLSYFKQVHRSLRPGGVFLMDVFGGTLCTDESEEATKHKKFTYYWQQENFDPITNRAVFHINFKVKGQKKVDKVFTYDWRMWAIPELREILVEAGFKKTHAYWEGTNRKGEGNDIYSRTEKGEACPAWISYIAAEK